MPWPPSCQSLPNERMYLPFGSNTNTVSIPFFFGNPWCVMYTLPAPSSATLCVVCHSNSPGSSPQL